MRRTLLGSVGMLRVLGGVFRELRAGDNPAELDDITEFFKRLDPHMVFGSGGSEDRDLSELVSVRCFPATGCWWRPPTSHSSWSSSAFLPYY